jgi:hypothetical protein
MQSKHQYYHNGVDNQKRADITIDLKRLDKTKIAEWTPEQKKELQSFIVRVDKIFNAFKNEILDVIK